MSKTEQIGAAVAAARKRRKMRPSELADAAGVSRSWLSRLERGRFVRVGMLPLRAIARVLGVSVDSLLDPPSSADKAA